MANKLVLFRCADCKVEDKDYKCVEVYSLNQRIKWLKEELDKFIAKTTKGSTKEVKQTAVMLLIDIHNIIDRAFQDVCESGSGEKEVQKT